MTRKLFILPLILLMAACTMTKRVHRPGYHIQWRTIERSKAPVKSEENAFKNQVTIEKSEDLPTPLAVDQIVDVPKSEIQEEDHPSVEDTPLLFEHTKQIEPNEYKNPTPSFTLEPSSVKSSSSKQKNIRPIFWRAAPATLKKIGVVLMILGGMTLFGSLLVYVGAFSGSNDGGWLNFFLDLLNISNWFWLLFFILLFIFVSWLFFLIVLHLLGGPLNGFIIGLSLIALGIFLYALGERRTPEP